MLTRTLKTLSFVLLAGTLAGGTGFSTAQTPSDSAASAGKFPVTSVINGTGLYAINPVESVRYNKSWEYGPFVNWGTGVGNRSDYKFFWAGAQLSKPLSPVVHAGIFSGQFEFGANLMPLWQAYTPAPHEQTFTVGSQVYVAPEGGGTYRGVSLTPVILRWNFLTSSRRFEPWFQGAGGLIYTTHKFPPDQLVPHGTPGGTSVWNFAPQGGGGIHYFVRPRRSIDLGVNAVHISSASLGDRNPGVNASIQLQVGYTYWK